MQGGRGPLLTGTSAQSVSEMSSRIYFGICPTIPVVRNVGQTLNQVQGDNLSSLRADACRRGNPVKNAAPPGCHAELVSASIQRCVLPVTPDRCPRKFRDKERERNF